MEDTMTTPPPDPDTDTAPGFAPLDFNPMAYNPEVLTFAVMRLSDVSGTSGVGVVAMGALFPDGTTVVQWQTHVRSVVVYNSYADALHIHGHGDLTGFCFTAAPSRLYLSDGSYRNLW